VSSPASPLVLGVYDTSGDANDLLVVGNRAYVADALAGVQIIDVGNPANPVRLGGYDTRVNAQGVTVVGTTALIADDHAGVAHSRLQRSGGTRPDRRLRYRRQCPRHSPSPAPWRSSRTGSAGVQLVDVAIPSGAVPLGRSASGGQANGLHVEGALVSVADGSLGLQFVDITDPRNPFRVGGVDTAGSAEDVRVVGNSAYVADGSRGLRIIPFRTGIHQTIAFSMPSALPVNSSPVELTATASSGLPVTLSIVSGPATLTGNQLTVTAAGTVVVRATQAGDVQFVPVAVDRTLTVLKLSQKVDWSYPAQGAVLSVGPAYPLHAVASSGLPVTYEIVYGPARIEGATVTMTDWSTVTLRAVQNGSSLYQAASSERAFNRMAVEGSAQGAWLGAIRGSALAVDWVGTTAYVAMGTVGLQIFDVADPANPVWLGGFDTGDYANAVQVVGTAAYVVGSASGLQIIDIANPASPVRLGGFDTSGAARGIQVVGTVAYVADGSAGLVIVDVSNRASPVLLGSYDTAGDASLVQVVGTVAYVADGSAGLVMVEVSDPTRPVFVGSYDTSGAARGVHVVGSVAYVADSAAGLQILDVGDSAHPVRLGGYDTPGNARAVQVVGTLAYVADEYSGVQIVDVSLPASPVKAGDYTATVPVYGLEVDGTSAYLAAGTAGLQVLDLGDPVSPVRSGGFDTAGYANQVHTVGSLAYVADGLWGLQVLDVSDPASPTRLGNYDTGGSAMDVEVVGTRAYVADGPTGLQIIDVGNPAGPVRLGGYDTSGEARGVHVVGNLAYVADGYAGLQIIDVSNPTSPQRAGGYDTPGYARNVQVVGTLAYVADDSAGLRLVDVANPAIPASRWGYTTAGSTWDVQVVGNLAYVVDSAGLAVLDVSSHNSPVSVGRQFVGLSEARVQLAGGVAYVAGGNARLEMVDVSRPTVPTLLGSHGTSGAVRGVHVVGDWAYLANGERGLQVARLRSGIVQSLSFAPPSSASLSESPLTLSAVVTSGLPVTFSVVSGPATVQGDQLTLTGVGDVVVRAEQAGTEHILPIAVVRTLSVTPAPDAQVVGRHVFYNQSVWDGNSAAANAADDGAIAPDKTALLPGGKATFANYTSYPRGLNGIMVDIQGLPGTPTAADFEFRVGNNQTPAGWASGPAPTSVALRQGAGIGGSDRVTLVWGADAPKKKWLQVSVLATAATGLLQPDVFYFGNAIGETGNSAADARVTSADALRVLNNISASVNSGNRYDVGRDGKVGAADRLQILNNLSVLDPLVLLNLGGGASLHAAEAPSGQGPVVTGIRGGPGAFSVEWISDGTSVVVWTATATVGAEWEIFDELGSEAPAGARVEFTLPVDADEPVRYYRIESRRPPVGDSP
jgi:hypothetical protein